MGEAPETGGGKVVGEVRERLLRIGADALSPPELMGLVIREGQREDDAVDLAQRLIRTFGGLRGTASRTSPGLRGVPGIGPGRAARLHATFALLRAWSEESLPRGAQIRTGADIFERFHPILRDRKREIFYSLLLDGKADDDDHGEPGGLAADAGEGLLRPRDQRGQAEEEIAARVASEAELGQDQDLDPTLAGLVHRLEDGLGVALGVGHVDRRAGRPYAQEAMWCAAQT